MISVCNEASAWGIVQNQDITIIVGIILLFIISYLWYNAKDKITRLGFVFVFLGGSSNLTERFYYGCVTDYWKAVNWWPAFNFADVIIVLGIFLIAIRCFRYYSI